MVIYPKATVVVFVAPVEDAVVADTSSLYIAILQNSVGLNLHNRNSGTFVNTKPN